MGFFNNGFTPPVPSNDPTKHQLGNSVTIYEDPAVRNEKGRQAMEDFIYGWNRQQGNDNGTTANGSKTTSTTTPKTSNTGSATKSVTPAKSDVSAISEKKDNSETSTGVTNVFEIYTEESEGKLNSSQEKKENEWIELMRTTALGKIDKWKNMTNIFGGKLKDIDWSALGDPDALKEKMKDWFISKGDEIKDSFLNKIDELKTQMIELAKEKLVNLIGGALDSVMVPDTIFLGGLSATYYTMGADLNYNGGYCRKVCIMCDYPESLKWCNGEFGYEYDLFIDKSLCLSDINLATKHGSFQVVNHILEKIYNDNYLTNYKAFSETNDIGYYNNMVQCENFIIESIKKTIVYSYQTFGVTQMTNMIYKYIDKLTNKPIFLPKYLGETDDRFNGKYYIRTSDLKIMAPYVNDTNDNLDGDDRKIIFKKKIKNRIKETTKEVGDSIFNDGSIVFSLTDSIISADSFEEHDPSKHEKYTNRKISAQIISLRNSFIKLMYMNLTDNKIWGDDRMVHCKFYAHLCNIVESPTTEVGNAVYNAASGLFGDIIKSLTGKNAAEREKTAYKYIETLNDAELLFSHSKFMEFGDVSNLVNSFAIGFPSNTPQVSDGTPPSPFITAETAEVKNDFIKTFNNKDLFTTDYYDEFIYFTLTTNLESMLFDVDSVFSKIFPIIVTIMESEKDDFYYGLKLLINEMLMKIHTTVFGSKHEGNTDNTETGMLARIIFPDIDYSNYANDICYCNIRIIYGMYIFYYLANMFKETNTQTLSLINSFDSSFGDPRTLAYDLTLRRYFRIIDSLILTAFYFSKEYSSDQDSTISVFVKEYMEVFTYLINSENVPENTHTILDTEMGFILRGLGIDTTLPQSVDAQLVQININKKYECLRIMNHLMSFFTNAYLVTNVFETDDNVNRDIHDENSVSINVLGFNEIYLNGLISIFSQVFNLFQNGIYKISNFEAERAGTVDIDDQVMRDMVTNDTLSEITKNGIDIKNLLPTINFKINIGQ